MRQVMPHRNNIELRRTKSKRYFSNRWKNRFKSRIQHVKDADRERRGFAEFAARTGIYMIIEIFAGVQPDTISIRAMQILQERGL
jgi:hypothetical protein